MIKKLLLLIITILTVSSCSLRDEESNLSIETLPIKQAEVPIEFDYGAIYKLKVLFDLPSGCHSFYDLFYQYENSTRIVAINSVVNTKMACTEVLIEREFEFEVKVTQQADYIFKFWKGTDNAGNDIFEEIIVPVVTP
jgi:ABC-type dipeptide/oligopeptide/nickel transport system permease subunit